MAKLIMEVKMQKLHETCLRCGRKLKTEQSKELGFGKVCWEKYNSEKIVEGINGFKGYYAFIFSKCCVLESAIYGNATYIIPKENWEILSQKTKKELFDENKVIGKIDHTAKWKQNVSDKFRMLEVVLSK